MTFTQQLANRILDVKFAGLPAETRYWGTISILDTLGVAIAGSREEGVRILDRVTTGGASTGGDCLLFGSKRRVSALEAAMVNGMAAHVLDFDASNPYFAGHATMQLLAGTYAIAEVVDASGADFLTAYVAGFEAQSRIARPMQPAHSERGWYASSTLGVFGVAAAAGYLLRLTPEQLTNALGTAANLASGLLVNSGTMTKPLAAGHCARNGVLAALLAQEGFTAPAASFEHRFGFLKTFDAGGKFDPDTALAPWGKPYDVEVTAIGIKQHPCCGSGQAGIDVMADLVAEHRLTPDQIESIHALILTHHFAHIDRPNPRDALEGKWSLAYCLARTVMEGRPRQTHFRGEAHLDPTARALMARITLGPHPSLHEVPERAKQGRAELTVTLKDGRVLTGARNKPVGRTPGEPLSDDQLNGKFLDCAVGVLAPGAGERVLKAVRSLDRLPKLREISAAMIPIAS